MRKEIKEVDKEKGTVRVTTTDERWYMQPARNPITGLPEFFKFVPSVTWICGFYPKGISFYKWLAEKGWDESQAIKSAAGDKGSKIHAAISDMLKGKTVKMEDKYVNNSTEQMEELTVEEYEAVISFKDWFTEVKPKVLAFDYVVINERDGYAGTVDLKCEINGEVWLIDFKSGQYVWPEYELQVSAYKMADTDAIKKIGILQVGYKRNKNKYKFTEVENKFDLFLAAKKIWKNETEGQVPSQKDLPLEVSLPTGKEEPLKVELERPLTDLVQENPVLVPKEALPKAGKYKVK